MRNLLLLLAALVVLPTAAQAQWASEGAFPAETPFTSAMHGVAVDGEGKVWLAPWTAIGRFVRAPGDTVNTFPLHVYNPDGTHASFSPIHMIPIEGRVDTLIAGTIANPRGLTTDHNGDILYVTGNGRMYRIDHQTGEGMNMVIPQATSLAAPAVDANGNIFTALVVNSAGPMRIYGPDFNFIENAIDTTRGFSRSFEVTADGTTVYWSGYSNLAIWKYTRPDEFSPFNPVPDTLFRGVTSESLTRHPVTGNIWFSAGPSGSGSATGGFSDFTWYEIDPDTDEIVDSLKWDVSAGVAAEKPRGIAFSPDGMTAYAVMFDANSGASSVQKFIFGGNIAVEPVGGVPEAFTLSQNYPNPFNPVTQITFGLKQSGHVSLRVFDTLGRQVAVLADEVMTAGTYEVDFDGRGLPSGTYLYVMSTGGQKMSRMMVLLK